MKKKLLIFLFGFLLIKPSSAQLLCVQGFDQNDSIGVNVGSNNLIINGGFENTTNCGWNGNFYTFCPNSSNYATYGCDILNWTCTGGGSASYPHFNDSLHDYVEEGVRAPYLDNNYCDACSTGEDTSCLHNSGYVVTGIPASGFPVNSVAYGGTTGVSLSQIVNGLVVGNTYILEFWAGGTYTEAGHVRGLFAVDVGFGNIFLRCKSTAPHIGIGTRFLVEFKATSASHTIKFTDWGLICPSCTAVILDNVRLYTPDFLPTPNALCTLGITEESQNNEMNIYPNPTDGVFQISLSQNNNTKGLKEIKVFNVVGEEILSFDKLKMTDNVFTIDITAYAQGIYYVRTVNEEGEIEMKKLVKE